MDHHDIFSYFPSHHDINVDFVSTNTGVVPDYRHPSPPVVGVPQKHGHHESNVHHGNFVGMDSDIFNLFLSTGTEKEFPIDLGFPVISKVPDRKPASEQEAPEAVISSAKERNEVSGSKNSRVGTKSIPLGRKRKFIPVTGTDKETSVDPNKKKPPKTPKDISDAALRDELGQEIDSDKKDDDDEKQMKRQRRLVKNREAAQLFRQRQKAYIQDLELKVTKLAAENSSYQSKVELLTAENKLVKEQLNYLRSFISQVMTTTNYPAPPTYNGYPKSAPHPPKFHPRVPM